MAKTIAKKKGKRDFDMRLELDFKSDFGIDFPVTQKLAEKLGDETIKQIIERTKQNKRLGGGNFTQYSKKYAKKKGVGRKDVNLDLFGDMLQSLDVVKTTKKKVTVGFDSNAEEPKAFNHHTGDTLPKRPFFGIQKNEIKEIKREMKSLIKREKNKSSEQKRIEAEKAKAQERAIRDIAAAVAGGLKNFG